MVVFLMTEDIWSSPRSDPFSLFLYPVSRSNGVVVEANEVNLIGLGQQLDTLVKDCIFSIQFCRSCYFPQHQFAEITVSETSFGIERLV